MPLTESDINKMKSALKLYDEFFDAVNISDAIDIVREWRGKAEKYDLVINSEPHGSAIDTLAQEIKELKGRYPKKIEWYEELERKFNIAFDETIKLKEYKAEVERLAKDDTLWHNVEKLDKIKKIHFKSNCDKCGCLNVRAYWRFPELKEILN